MKASAVSPRLTGDGSYTLYDPVSDECFHSSNGALTESEHVFIAAGQLRLKLQHAKQNNTALHLLEMGLGTGLNYLLSAREAIAAGTTMHYHALELNLLNRQTMESLGYRDIPGLRQPLSELLEIIDAAHNLGTGDHSYQTRCGSLRITVGDARECALPSQTYQLCYFDAFSPASEPELWTLCCLQKYYAALSLNGTWVSYCARGAVRRDLQACGFAVEKLPGPPGKREILRATRLN